MHVPAWPVLPDSTLAPAAVLEKFRVRALAGLGDPCFPGDPDYDPTICAAPTPIPTSPSTTGSADLCSLYPAMCQGSASVTPASPDATVTSSTGAIQTGYTIPSQSSTAWANVAAALIKGGMTLAQIQSIQPGTVVSANGAILRQSTGLPVPVTNVSGNLGVSASPGAGLAIAAVAGLIALVVISKGGR